MPIKARTSAYQLKLKPSSFRNFARVANDLEAKQNRLTFFAFEIGELVLAHGEPITDFGRQVWNVKFRTIGQLGGGIKGWLQVGSVLEHGRLNDVRWEKVSGGGEKKVKDGIANKRR